MKYTFSIVILLLSQHLFGQGEENQRIENGKRIGTWPEYYANGELKLIRVYGTPVKLTVRDKATAFALGVYNSEDSIFYWEKIVFTDFYEYDESWKPYRIRREYSHGETIYVFGEDEEIGVSEQIFSIDGRVFEKVEVVIPIVNFSDNDLKLIPHSPFENIHPLSAPIVLSQNDTTLVLFEVEIQPGTNSYTFYLEVGSTSIDFTLRQFGYDLTTKDLHEIDLVKTNRDNLIYYRKGDEALLELYDFTKSTLLNTYSLGVQKTVINLEKLEPARYWLKFIDYANEQVKWCELNLEKQ